MKDALRGTDLYHLVTNSSDMKKKFWSVWEWHSKNIQNGPLW